MKQIVLIAFMAIAAFSCRKNKNVSKVCPGSFVGLTQISYDSAVLTEIDENGIPALPSPYPAILARGSHSDYLCYSKKDGCVYSLTGNDSSREIFIYKYDLTTKKTEVFTCTNSSYISYEPYNWHFWYNSFTDKFYVSYFYFGLKWYEWGKYEISFSGNTFTGESFSMPGETPPMVIPNFIDEQNGNMYFSNGDFFYYSPLTKDTGTFHSSSYLFYGKSNPNDGKLYGFNYDYNFIRIDPKTGGAATLSNVSAYTYDTKGSTFDACNNQYIFWTNDKNVNIYWIDAGDGKMVKHAATTFS